MTILTLLHCKFTKTDYSSERKNPQYISRSFHIYLGVGGGDYVGQSRMDHLIADIHVLLMAIVSSVNFGLHRPRCAVTFYRLRRQSRVIRILPVLPFLLAVVALFFFIVIPGDLWKETCMTCKSTRTKLVYITTSKLTMCKNEVCQIYYTNLDISFLSIRFPLPLFVFAFLFLAGGVFMFLAAVLFITLAVPIPFLILFLFLLVSVGEEKTGVIKMPWMYPHKGDLVYLV